MTSQSPSFPRFEDQSHNEGVRIQPGRMRFKTLLLIFHPLIYKVLSLKSEREQNMLPFTFA